MKTAALPSVRVAPGAREKIESVLRDGETLSAFVENAALREANYRSIEAEFAKRGRASLAKARATGETVSVRSTMEKLDQIISAKFGIRKTKA